MKKLFITILYCFYLFSVFRPTRVVTILFTHYTIIVKCFLPDSFTKYIMRAFGFKVFLCPRFAVAFSLFCFVFFFFFCPHMLTLVHKKSIFCTVAILFIYCSNTVHALKNIKNGSHGTIHTFKNYFVTVLLVFSFSNNKFNPNGPLIIFSLYNGYAIVIDLYNPCALLYVTFMFF